MKARNIASGQVTTRHLKEGAVTSGKIRDRSIRLTDLSSEIASAKGVLGPQGPQGKDGAPGKDGAAGRDGAAVADLATFTPPGLPRYTQGGQLPVELYRHTWSQPANTVDEVSGFATVRWPVPCQQVSSVANVAFVIDGQLASPSSAKNGVSSNGPVGTPAIDQLTALATVTGSTLYTAPLTDHAPLPIERYQFVTGDQASEHTLVVYGRSTGCYVAPNGAEPTFDGTLIVHRYQR